MAVVVVVAAAAGRGMRKNEGRQTCFVTYCPFPRFSGSAIERAHLSRPLRPYNDRENVTSLLSSVPPRGFAARVMRRIKTICCTGRILSTAFRDGGHFPFSRIHVCVYTYTYTAFIRRFVFIALQAVPPVIFMCRTVYVYEVI